MRQFYFESGCPRSGSTLLANILSQNPRIMASHTSGIMDIMFSVRNNWNQLIEFKAHPDNEALQRVLKGILYSYYENQPKPIILDKCRGWLSLIEMAEWTLEQKVKILVPIRDIKDILTSFEKLYRETAKTGQIASEAENYFQFQTVEGRCDFWMRNNQVVGLAVNRIKDALQRGYRDRMHFVPFEDLTNNPANTLLKIYNFLGEPYFSHDFENVKQVTWENDEVHGFKGLHTIQPRVKPHPSQWKEILGPFAEKYNYVNEIWNIK